MITPFVTLYDSRNLITHHFTIISGFSFQSSVPNNLAIKKARMRGYRFTTSERVAFLRSFLTYIQVLSSIFGFGKLSSNFSTFFQFTFPLAAKSELRLELGESISKLE